MLLHHKIGIISIDGNYGKALSSHKAQTKTGLVQAEHASLREVLASFIKRTKRF